MTWNIRETGRPWLINHRYGTTFPTQSPAQIGKSMGYTDWTHVRLAKAPEVRP